MEPTNSDPSIAVARIARARTFLVYGEQPAEARADDRDAMRLASGGC